MPRKRPVSPKPPGADKLIIEAKAQPVNKMGREFLRARPSAVSAGGIYENDLRMRHMAYEPSHGRKRTGQGRRDTMVGGMAQVSVSFPDAGARVDECRLTALVTQRAEGEGFTTRRLADYTEELAAANGIRAFEGCGGFTRQWCVDFCSERLGQGFDPATGELVWRA